MTDTTLIHSLKLLDGRMHSECRLYYFEGNFYWPFFSLNGCEIGRIKRAIRGFTQDNLAMITEHRSRPEYKTIPELFDEVPA